MPRQIIDTESGRPAYRRRITLRWIIIVVLVVIAILVAFELWRSTRPRMTTGMTSAPGKVAHVLQTTVRFPHPRRMYAA
jgi:uncharacterized membrane protein AbrB (regulator of aidB expression)